MVITIIGTGYVGLTSAAIFANAGHRVYAVDTNPERLAIIQSGRSFFYEDHLNPLIEEGLSSGLLIPTASYEESIPESDIIFSCVGTPDNPDGSSNLSYIFNAAEEAAKYFGDSSKIFVQKSTVPVGTGQKLITLFEGLHVEVSYVSNPEFLREGTALLDSLWFDRIVIGGDNDDANQTIEDLYRGVGEQRGNIAARASITPPQTDPSGEYIITGLSSAELIKTTANAFLATKITFANSIAKLADASGADITEVMNAVGADSRIGRAFFNAGRGYGGGCFPKDVSGLISSAIEYGVELDILHSVTQENESMAGYVIDKAMQATDESLSGKNITVLGLSFKAGTSDVRKSPAIKIANSLLENVGAHVTVYDPFALEEQQTKDELKDGIKVATSLSVALESADAVFVATNWPEFTALPPEDYAAAMQGKLFVDCMNSFSPGAIREAGLTYVGVGR